MARESATQRNTDPRERILTAAAELFAERGFAAAGVDEIARRAGVNKAMLYYHIGDKSALLSTVVVAYLERLRTEVRTAVARERNPRERLLGVISAFFGVFGAAPPFPQIMLRELVSGGTNLPPEALHTMGDIMGITRGVLEEGRTAGVFRDVNPVFAHLLVVGSAFFLTNAQRMRWRADELRVPQEAVPRPESVSEVLGDLILNGIAVRNDPGGER